jgi:hypothetical protein
MRMLRCIGAWCAYWLVLWTPAYRFATTSLPYRMWFALLPYAGRWAYAADMRECGNDPWGPAIPEIATKEDSA